MATRRTLTFMQDVLIDEPPATEDRPSVPAPSAVVLPPKPVGTAAYTSVRSLCGELEELVARLDAGWESLTALLERIDAVIVQGKAAPDAATRASLRDTWRQLTAAHADALTAWEQDNARYRDASHALDRVLTAFPDGATVFCPTCREQSGTAPLHATAALAYGRPCGQHGRATV